MVPYLGWAVFYGVLVRILNGFGMHWPELNLRDFVYSAATDGTTFGINGAAWFVPALFAVTAVYTVLRKCLGRCWKDGVMLLLFMALGAATVAVTGGGICHKALILYKIGFFLPFFQLGYFFGKRLERWFDSVNTLGMCIVLALINVLLLAGDMPIDMGRLAFLSDLSADHCLLPLITSVTGIFFWLKIAKFLVPVLGESKLVNYISSHTFFIMMHHLLFIQIFGALLYGGMALGIPSLAGFDPAAFRGDPWYLYLPGEWMKAAYFLFSITGTTLACKGFDWLKLRCGRGKS